jgi:hypothetical protein
MLHIREVAAVRIALLSLDGTSPLSDREVESAICRMVDVLKDAGWPIEAIVVELKKHLDGVAPSDRRQIIHRKSVRWCIKHYFNHRPQA